MESSKKRKKRKRRKKETEITSPPSTDTTQDIDTDPPANNNNDNTSNHDTSTTYSQKRQRLSPLLPNSENPSEETSGILVKSSKEDPPKKTFFNSQSQSLRKLRGLLNRLSESNFEGTLGSIVSLFEAYGRDEMVSDFKDLVLRPASDPLCVLSHVLPLQCAVLTGLHLAVGPDFAAKFVHSLCLKFAETLEDGRKYDTLPPEERNNQDDELRNLTVIAANHLQMISFLYHFESLGCAFLYDIIRTLIQDLNTNHNLSQATTKTIRNAGFCQIDVELLLVLLTSCGPKLRSDDPTSLKDIVLELQKRANAYGISMTNESKQNEEDNAPNVVSKQFGRRIEFMLEAIYDLKNNKISHKTSTGMWGHGLALGGSSSETVTNLVGKIKALKHKAGKTAAFDLEMTFQESLNEDVMNRRWVVGAAYSGKKEEWTKEEKATENDEIDIMARRLRMNTNIRRAIFRALFASEDYAHAFEKLLKLNLKGKQDREIVHVVIECVAQERAYNPFYALLTQRLCSYDHNYKFTLQYAFWDQFKMISEFSVRKISCLAKLLAALLDNFSLSLSILKVVTFESLDAKSTMFFRIVFSEIITNNAMDSIVKIFGRIVGPPQLQDLREGLKDFLKLHVKTHIKSITSSENYAPLKQKLKLAQKTLKNKAALLS